MLILQDSAESAQGRILRRIPPMHNSRLSTQYEFRGPPILLAPSVHLCTEGVLDLAMTTKLRMHMPVSYLTLKNVGYSVSH